MSTLPLSNGNKVTVANPCTASTGQGLAPKRKSPASTDPCDTLTIDQYSTLRAFSEFSLGIMPYRQHRRAPGKSKLASNLMLYNFTLFISADNNQPVVPVISATEAQRCTCYMNHLVRKHWDASDLCSNT